MAAGSATIAPRPAPSRRCRPRLAHPAESAYDAILTCRKSGNRCLRIIRPPSASPRQVPDASRRPLPIAPSMLEAQNLAARRGYAELFRDIGFRVKSGAALIVTGPNGTGKTTLLRMLAGLSAPAAGEIRWNGQRIDPFSMHLRAVVAYAGHLPALKDELTTEENLVSLVGLSGARRPGPRSAAPSTALRCRTGVPCPRDCSPPASAGASGSPGCSLPDGRCGSSTSRSRRSTPPGRRCSPGWCTITSTVAASPSPPRTRRSASSRRGCSRLCSARPCRPEACP